MVKNVVNWVNDWQYAQKLVDLLKKTEKDNMITRLCFREDCWACFRTEDKADDFLRGLSEQCTGKTIGHEWAAEDDCGASLWQDGRELRCTLPRETPEWCAIIQSVNDKVETWEVCRDFHDKLDSCWDRGMAKWRGLPAEQIRERSDEIAAVLCYRRLWDLSWHKTWIACLNQMEDPLGEVQDAFHSMQSTNLHFNIETAVWDVIAKYAIELNKQGQEQSM